MLYLYCYTLVQYFSLIMLFLYFCFISILLYGSIFIYLHTLEIQKIQQNFHNAAFILLYTNLILFSYNVVLIRLYSKILLYDCLHISLHILEILKILKKKASIEQLSLYCYTILALYSSLIMLFLYSRLLKCSNIIAHILHTFAMFKTWRVFH